jgi:uncharacterized membrane protein
MTGPGVGGEPGRSTVSTSGTGGAWAAVAVLLGIGIVVPLLVFLYDSATPTLWGFPFYYWFQFLMIPIVSALTFAAFRISLAATRRDREALGLPRDAGDPEDRGQAGPR